MKKALVNCMAGSLFALAIILGSLLGWYTSNVSAEKLVSFNSIRARTTAASWGWMFNDPWYEPHYGATFRGSFGKDPNYSGPGGNAATALYSGGIKAWNWWGGELGVLLTPKRWCYPAAGCEAARQNPQNYNAIVTR